jgi:3-oxoacyl-[acyl-carrier protein] reductase
VGESQAHDPLVPANAPAVVTGASRGIGRAIALKLAASGRPVGLIARSKDALETVAMEARQLYVQAEAVVCDVAEPRQLVDAIERIRQVLGPVRVLVNNAGWFLDRPMPGTTLEEWERIVRVNLTAPFVAAQAVWPQMVEAGGGVIVNIASKAGTQGYVGQSAYCATKGGLLGWARALALEGRPQNVRVHNVCPGGVRTELIAGTALADRLKGQVMLEADDVAEVVQFCITRPGNVDLPDVLMSRFES